MSQVIFKTEKYEIQAGYDLSLDYFHLTIWNNGEDEPIFSDEQEKGWPLKTTDKYKDVLKKYDIKPPLDFWYVIEQKEGNVRYTWNNSRWVGKEI